MPVYHSFAKSAVRLHFAEDQARDGYGRWVAIAGVTAAGKSVKFHRGDVNQAVHAAARMAMRTKKPVYVVPGQWGYRHEFRKPPAWQQHVEVNDQAQGRSYKPPVKS